MKVKVPDPIHPVLLYELSFESKKFKLSKLEIMLGEIEEKLDSVCEELKSGKYTFVGYEVLFYVIDNSKPVILGDILQGGFVLSVEEGKVFALPDFQQRYKSSFGEILREYKEDMLFNAKVEVVGSRDHGFEEVEAQDPNL